MLCATGAILVAARAMGLWPGDSIMLAAAAVATGVVVVWSRRDDRPPGSGRAWVGRGLQVAAGVVLLAAGVISLANRTGGLANVGASAAAIAVVVGGLAMFAAPAVGRLLRSLDEERAMRIREDERAAVAAHLHDSVLQSLVLIQRSDDPRRMASLARRQERELRAWLYGATEQGDPTSLHAAIDALTVEIEADHDIRDRGRRRRRPAARRRGAHAPRRAARGPRQRRPPRRRRPRRRVRRGRRRRADRVRARHR